MRGGGGVTGSGAECAVVAGLPALGPSARRSSHTDARGSGSFSLAFDAGVAAASRSKSVHVILKQKVKVTRAAPEYASPGSRV